MKQPAVQKQPGNETAMPLSHYIRMRDFYAKEFAAITRSKNTVSNLRLVTVIIAIAGAVALYRMHHELLMSLTLLSGTVLFSALAFWHSRLFVQADDAATLTAINANGMDRCNGTWHSFAENGEEFTDHDHPYTSDLDIFGKGSLYQYCSCAHTRFGKARLAELFCGPATGTTTDIASRQQAIAELARDIAWRQSFETAGYALDAADNPEKIIAWGESVSSRHGERMLDLVSWLLPACTIGLFVLHYLLHISILPGSMLATLQLLLTGLFARNNLRTFALFDKNARALTMYSRLIERIAARSWESAWCKDAASSISGTTGASRALRHLAATVSASEVRFSPLAWIVANALLLWDIRCACKLATWKRLHGVKIRSWYAAIAEFEALASCAVLRFEHPTWIFPEVKEYPLHITGTGIGHPLLADTQRIANDFAIGGQGGEVAIITGSNMSGKSTFLRTIGCNCVLAFAGAPVCAQTFSCSPFSLFTSMRTGDNLLSHTSTFYAELLRVKKTVDFAASKRPLVYLFDELFRGTNSSDRHDGAVALITSLSQPHTLGFVATHDLELCQLATTHPKLINYHFSEQYESDAIRFDYLLRTGPSTTRNALYLMRMVGIDV